MRRASRARESVPQFWLLRESLRAARERKRGWNYFIWPQTAVEESAAGSSVRPGQPFGSEAWMKKTVEQLEQEITIQPIGRVPTKSISRPGFSYIPMYRGDGKYLVQGCGSGGRWLQVIYVLDDDGTLFVIHARAMIDREKRRHRRK